MNTIEEIKETMEKNLREIQSIKKDKVKSISIKLWKHNSMINDSLIIIMFHNNTLFKQKIKKSEENIKYMTKISLVPQTNIFYKLFNHHKNKIIYIITK